MKIYVTIPNGERITVELEINERPFDAAENIAASYGYPLFSCKWGIA